VTVRSLTRRAEAVGPKLFVNSFFSADLFYDLHTIGINCCRTLRQNFKEMVRGFANKAKKFGTVLNTCYSER
jgi:hypothetical protein